MAKYKDRFPADVPTPAELPNTEYHWIWLKDAEQKIRIRMYSCPQQYQESWQTLI